MAYESQKTVARDSLLLRSLPDTHVGTLLSQARWQHYDRGENIFLQEETSQAIHVVIDGWVKLFRIAPTGSEAVVSVFTRGESFGEAVALRNLPYPVSAEAVTACEVMHIPSSAVISLIKQDPEIGVSILASAFTHLHSLVSQLEQLKARTGAQRVAEFLLNLCAPNAQQCDVTLPYDKMLIAARLGMKPESLSRAFTRLKPVGVSVKKNHAEISDTLKLREYADADPADSWSKP
ncbi:Crp/Fnr family transcriptional regulator [Phaeobacter gallaeciensis]|uniref:Crp/Fnr family transcriptional regulator n=2 Tax=Roseobacteraceae TaxID=2854170 RepID=A0A366XBP9_9RHOB|nr:MULTISPECIES: Crp/Fnr family transcriptional regulator [Roseobacteraceae]MBT3142497.1 Crp/Fnr family transcriptional regulator [Falsiruegeria litorea]MBT8169275.1 Crp/Fnr family transcriptional regulator [Falsiruegeria litorea]RBW60512.1 Crp/Fnr family transcriptional regulator [Phaeobacter gallaeciensis]